VVRDLFSVSLAAGSHHLVHHIASWLVVVRHERSDPPRRQRLERDAMQYSSRRSRDGCQVSQLMQCSTASHGRADYEEGRRQEAGSGRRRYTRERTASVSGNGHGPVVWRCGL
jgi:hypothetical protein